MRSMMVCTDGSPHARVALDYARYWTERMRLSVLKVLFVEDLRLTQGPLVTGYYGPVGMAPSPAYPAFYDELVQTVKEQGRRTIEEARRLLDGLKAQVEYVVREGIVHDSILAEAKTVDMLCLGRQGEHGEWEGRGLGTTVEKVLRRSERPVLVTPAKFHEITRMLVAYDGSRPANRALRAACSLASEEKLPMAVVTVCASDHEHQRCDATLAEARELASAYKEVDSTFARLSGVDTEVQLLNHAAQEGCDLIVMGAYGHSKIREWLLGSTTSGVLVRCEHPVLLVR